jgi:hypothetical protein
VLVEKIVSKSGGKPPYPTASLSWRDSERVCVCVGPWSVIGFSVAC